MDSFYQSANFQSSDNGEASSSTQGFNSEAFNKFQTHNTYQYYNGGSSNNMQNYNESQYIDNMAIPAQEQGSRNSQAEQEALNNPISQMLYPINQDGTKGFVQFIELAIFQEIMREFLHVEPKQGGKTKNSIKPKFCTRKYYEKVCDQLNGNSHNDFDTPQQYNSFKFSVPREYAYSKNNEEISQLLDDDITVKFSRQGGCLYQKVLPKKSLMEIYNKQQQHFAQHRTNLTIYQGKISLVEHAYGDFYDGHVIKKDGKDVHLGRDATYANLNDTGISDQFPKALCQRLINECKVCGKKAKTQSEAGKKVTTVREKTKQETKRKRELEAKADDGNNDQSGGSAPKKLKQETSSSSSNRSFLQPSTTETTPEVAAPSQLGFNQDNFLNDPFPLAQSEYNGAYPAEPNFPPENAFQNPWNPSIVPTEAAHSYDPNLSLGDPYPNPWNPSIVPPEVAHSYDPNLPLGNPYQNDWNEDIVPPEVAHSYDLSVPPDNAFQNAWNATIVPAEVAHPYDPSLFQQQVGDASDHFDYSAFLNEEDQTIPDLSLELFGEL